MRFSKVSLFISILVIGLAFFVGVSQGSTTESNSLLARSEEFTDTYQPYTKELFDSSLAKGDTVVLFFWAPWCSTCSIHDNDFKEHMKELPKNVMILRVHFDNEITLKKDLGVLYKDTFIVFTKKNGEVSRWIGSTFDDTKDRLNRLESAR